MEQKSNNGCASDCQCSGATETAKLPVHVHLLCGWPLLLVVIGGAIGGLCGGAAYGINMAIYKGQMPLPVKVGLNIVTGVAAIVLWVVSVAGIKSYFAG